jgi:hypothetical protein
MTRTALFIRVAFVTLCVAALAAGLSAYGVSDTQQANERRLGGQLLTMMFGFPTAFFGAGVVSDVARHFGFQTFDVATTPARYVGDWLIVALLGYVQWFVIVPGVWRLLRWGARRAKVGQDG